MEVLLSSETPVDFTEVRGDKTQKTAASILTAVRTSGPTL
jgi:hypothetical protein